jgi:hypothetical protein
MKNNEVDQQVKESSQSVVTQRPPPHYRTSLDITADKVMKRIPTIALIRILFAGDNPINSETGMSAAAIPSAIAIRVIIL